MSAEASTDVGALAKALALAQGEIRAAEKDRENPFFNSAYATLASVWEACRLPLSKNDLSVVQQPINDAECVGVVTTLLHGSGQWMRSTLFAKPKDSSPQSLGSAITYVRRYALAAVAGVAPDDDDGNAAQGDPNKKWVAAPKGAAEGKAPAPNGNQGAPSATTPSPSRAVPANRIPHDGTFANPKQVQLIHVLKAKVGGLSDDLYRRQLAAFKDCDGKPITTSKDLSEAQAAHLISRYEAKIKEQEATAAKGIDLNALPTGNVRELTRKLAQERDIAAEDILSIFGVDSLEQLNEADAVNAYALVSAWGTEQFDRVRDSIQTRA